MRTIDALVEQTKLEKLKEQAIDLGMRNSQTVKDLDKKITVIEKDLRR